MILSGASSERNSAATTFSENPGTERFTLALFLSSLLSFGGGLAPGYTVKPASRISASSLTCRSPRGDLMSTCAAPSLLLCLSLALMLQAGRTQKAANSALRDSFAIAARLNLLRLDALMLNMGGTS